MKTHAFIARLWLSAFFMGAAPFMTAQAQDMPPPSYAGGEALIMVGCDRDYDLVTTQAEMTTCAADMFALADKDRSQVVSLFELEDWRTIFIGNNDHPPFRLEFDRNLDNRITQDEFAQVWRARFIRLDKDRNGILSRTELYRPLPRPNFASMPRGGPPGGPPGGMPPGGPGGPGGGGGRPPF
jgi:EF hand